VIAPARYRAPRTLQEATRVLAGEPSPVVVAGGTWVLPQLHRRVRSAATLLDIRRLAIDGIIATDAGLRIGAAATYSDLTTSSATWSAAPLIAHMAGVITGGVQLRNQATVGGSACYATPSSDVPGCLVALQARLELHGPGGERDIAAADFFTGPGTTARREDELLVAITVPPQTGRWHYEKLKLGESSWPIVTAAGIEHPEIGAWVTLAAAVPTPHRVHVPEAERLEAAFSERLADAWQDVLAPADYRRAVAPAILARAWRGATGDERV
jgi:aerobic carbon-monoxide dehydrogenase medium subunit